MFYRRRLIFGMPLGLLALARGAGAQTPPPAPAGAPPTFGATPPVGPDVTPATFAEAEKLMQVALTPAAARDGRGSWRVSLASTMERRTGPRKLALAPERRAGHGVAARRHGAARRSRSRQRERFLRSGAPAGPLPSRDEDIAYAPVTKLSRWIETRALTSERLTRIYLARIAPRPASCARDHADGRARARAGAPGRPEIAAGRYRGPLHGIPYGVKDLLDTPASHHLGRRVPSRPRAGADSRRGGEAERRRRGADRQAEPGRAGAERHLVRRPDHESVAAGRGRIGFERRPGRGHRGRPGRVLDRQRDRRQHRQPGHALRRHRPAPDLRPRAAHRRDDAVLVARQARPDDAHAWRTRCWC
jgi:hypothetical protein